MKHSEAAELLTYAAAFDRRTVGEADVIAWATALDGLNVERCKAAIITHYRRSTDYLQPAHLWALARATSTRDVDPALRQHCEHGTYCDACKGIHHRGESCSVLEPPPDNVGEITSATKRAALIKAPPRSDLVQPHGLPPADGLDVTRCLCGAAYLDNPTGHESHRTVFGHQPRQEAS